MKKYRLLAIFLVLIFLLSSCKKNDKINFLSYQAYPFSAHGILLYDGNEYEVSVLVEKAGDLSLTVIRPELIANTVFTLKDGAVSVTFGDITQTVEDGGYSASEGILLSSHMFSLSSEDFSSAGVTSEDGVKFSYAEYEVSCGNVRVYVQNGFSSPEKLTASLRGHEFSFVFMNES